MASGILPNDNPERASLTLNFGLRDLWYGTAFSETATKAVSALQIIAVDVGYAMVEKTSCSLWPQCRPREFLRYATEDRPRQEHRLPQHAEANRRPRDQTGQAASGGLRERGYEVALGQTINQFTSSPASWQRTAIKQRYYLVREHYHL
jgi:hypothetical protein